MADVTERSLQIVSRKRHPGRPPLDEASSVPSAAVHLKLPAQDYDRVTELAKRSRVSVQDIIRTGLRRFLDERGNVI